jgi:hypothetical protein
MMLFMNETESRDSSLQIEIFFLRASYRFRNFWRRINYLLDRYVQYLLLRHSVNHELLKLKQSFYVKFIFKIVGHFFNFRSDRTYPEITKKFSNIPFPMDIILVN